MDADPEVLETEIEAALDPQELTEELRPRHRRKSSFMPGFERLVAGRSPSPSLLDRARARWRESVGGEEETP